MKSVFVLLVFWQIILCQMPVKIQDIQSVPFPNTNDASPLLNQFVEFSGVVTGIYPNLQIIIVQDHEGGPNSGIVIQSSELVGDVSQLVQMNDLVKIEGNVTEFGIEAGRTEFGTTNTAASNLTVIERNVTPPTPILVTAIDLNPFPNDAERFESVLVTLQNTVAGSPIGLEQPFVFFPQDSTGVAIADNGLNLLSVSLPEEGDEITFVTGILFFIVASDQFQLRPRMNSDLSFISRSEENSDAIIGGVIGAVVGCCCIILVVVAAFFGVKLIVEKRNEEINREFSEENSSEPQYLGMGTLSRQGALDSVSTQDTALLQSKSTFEIPYNEITLSSKIGEGAYGIVWLGTWRKTQCAIKQLKPDTVTNDMQEVNTFRSEAELMGKLKHPNVIQTLGVVTHPNHPFCIVTEFFARGSLLALLQTYSPQELHSTDPSLKFKIALDVATGMVYLHAEGIVHRDLAARNILLTTDCKAKITDFGLSRVLTQNQQEQTTKSEVGPLKWMAPESISRRVFSRNSDVWMYGVVLFELISHKQPYGDMDPLQACFEVANQRLQLKDYLPKDNNNLTDPQLMTMMQTCLKFDPKDRPDFETLLDMFKP